MIYSRWRSGLAQVAPVAVRKQVAPFRLRKTHVVNATRPSEELLVVQVGPPHYRAGESVRTTRWWPGA
jgi:hypothetical protein